MIQTSHRRGQSASPSNPVAYLHDGSRRLNHIEREGPKISLGLVPMELLDAMDARGWGSTPREKIPANWQETFGPEYNKGKSGGRPVDPGSARQRRKRR